jgi:CheY-like chemotaxis protein
VAALCKSILIVDDNRDICEAIKEALDDSGYASDTAADGREGLERLRTMESPCLVLLDLMMPVMNGIEFLEALKAEDRLVGTRIVVVSAYDRIAQTVAASGFLQKPVNLDVLMKTVKQHCGEPSRTGSG